MRTASLGFAPPPATDQVEALEQVTWLALRLSTLVCKMKSLEYRIMKSLRSITILEFCKK